MQVKILSAMTEIGLEKKVNTFLENKEIEVIDIKFEIANLGFYAMVMYKPAT